MCGIVGLAELKRGASRELVEHALEALRCMEHRGGSLDGTGDGAGLLLRPERSFFDRFLTPSRRVPEGEELTIGTIWFVRGERNLRELQRDIDGLLRREGLAALGWRKVPVDPSVLGVRAREDMPIAYQVFVAQGHRMREELRSALRMVRTRIETEFAGQVAVPSLAPGTTVYKALANSSQLAGFYDDLRDPSFTTKLVVGHRRFATNTFSNWHLVQPFRMLAHNGEINTISANTRALLDVQEVMGANGVLLRHGSDSAQLDRALDFLSEQGVGDLPETMRRALSPDVSGQTDPRERAYLEASRRILGTLGAWEGPAALLATDGHSLVAQLDRMGLRPLRYTRTVGGRVLIASEVGVVPVTEPIVEEGQLEPGGMLVVDCEEGELISPSQVGRWLIGRTKLSYTGLSSTDLLPLLDAKRGPDLPVATLQAFGWTRPRAASVRDTVKAGGEPVHSMGNDKPLAIFSENQSRVYSFLHQVIAVVTNPAIDPLREGQAMDTTVYLGSSPSLRDPKRLRPQYRLEHPVLTDEATAALVSETHPDLHAVVLDATFPRVGSARDMVLRLHELAEEAVQATKAGATVLILSDRAAADPERLPIPAVFGVGHAHRRLTRAGVRRHTSLVVETGDVHESHDLAVLIAYGATAVNPYAMLQIARDTKGFTPDDADASLVEGLVKGLRRIMSKMGITSVAGYRGSGLFEAVGLSADVVDYYLRGTPTRVGGLTMEDIHADIVARAEVGTATLPPNRNTSVYRKEVTRALQLVARNGNDEGDWDRFTALLAETPPIYLRDLLRFRQVEPVALDALDALDAIADVEEVVSTTLCGAAMSHGALHSTAHRAIAAAFNELGGRSNSGEGGEDPRRNPGGVYQAARNRTRQVASGRFGVDAAYLGGADEIEVKIGQGAKPGEGGHLPASKVTAEIAAIRKTQVGVALISPPPHHDIYSIEDLAQLIRNLRRVNPRAVIAVKLPSVTNLGTIAVGAAKAGAQLLTISGFEGGTGAASSGSILHAGLPLELGLTDAHQSLARAGIRDQVRVRADGGIKCGLDVVKVLALGADEVALGTALMVAENCIFCRGCNHGRCPVGLATQDPDRQERLFLRHDRPEEGGTLDERYLEARAGVVRYLRCLAEDVRVHLARLGLTHPSQLVGRVDLLEAVPTTHPRWSRLDLSELLVDARDTAAAVPPLADAVDEANLKLLRAGERVLSGVSRDVLVRMELHPANQALGGTLAGHLARVGGLPHGGAVRVEATGYAGQGFGFAATSGMVLRLRGFANDCVGEVMSGDAVIVLQPPEGHDVAAPHLAGNAVGYGASGGQLYVAGRVGQRFGVRNSGATLVCEGVGKYAFEYMTGGVGVVLGACGDVIASGMTGGELFLLDPTARARIHSDAAASTPDDAALERLRAVLTAHVQATGSALAGEQLATWEQTARLTVWVRAASR